MSWAAEVMLACGQHLQWVSCWGTRFNSRDSAIEAVNRFRVAPQPKCLLNGVPIVVERVRYRCRIKKL